MTKNEAYKSFRCFHCVFLDHESGMCLCGDLESDECQKDTKEGNEKND